MHPSADVRHPLAGRLGPGDLLVDLAWNIGTLDLLQWCRDAGVLYVNAPLEVWDAYAGGWTEPPTSRTLYRRHLGCPNATPRSATGPKRVDEFVNTWSVDGFYEGGVAPAEMGWGTHERTLPPLAHVHEDGPRNQICLARPGCRTWVRSWVPAGDITGMVIRHGESFTISDLLTPNFRLNGQSAPVSCVSSRHTTADPGARVASSSSSAALSKANSRTPRPWA